MEARNRPRDRDRARASEGWKQGGDVECWGQGAALLSRSVTFGLIESAHLSDCCVADVNGDGKLDSKELKELLMLSGTWAHAERCCVPVTWL